MGGGSDGHQWVCGQEALDDIEAEWETLVTRLDQPPFLRPGWFQAWQESFGGDLNALTIRRGRELVGLLVVDRSPDFLRLPANTETPYFDAITGNDELRRVLLTTALSLSKHHLVIPCLPAEQRTVIDDFCAIAERRGYRLMMQPCRLSPYVDVTGTWTDYLGSQPKKQRHEIRRHRRRLREAGDVEIRVHDGTRNLEGLLAEGFRLEASGWKEEFGTAIVSQARLQGFYTRLAQWAAEQGWLRLVFLELDGMPIAFDYVLEHANVRWVLKTGFDPEAHHLSPGTVLRSHEIETAFDDDTRRYELLGTMSGSHEAWKAIWANARRELLRIEAFDGTLRGRFLYAHETHWQPLRDDMLDRVHESLSRSTRERLHHVVAPLKRAQGR